MSRYVDVEKFQNAIRNYYPQAEYAINQIPCASVVPRFEYDKLEAENKELKRQLGAAINLIEFAEESIQEYAETVVRTLRYNINEWRGTQPAEQGKDGK